MTGTAARTDLGFGLGLALTVVALVAAIAMGGAGFVGALETLTGEGHTGGLQVIAGVALTGALAAGGLAIVAMHTYAD